MKISEIMTKNVITSEINTSVEEVAKMLIDNNIHGIPIVSEGKILGIITETDFFTKGAVNVYLPTYIDVLKNDRLLQNVSDEEREGIEKLLYAKAGDIMTSPCISIEQEADIHELLGLIKGRKLHSVPVVDENKNLCGIITLADIINLLRI